MSPVSKQQVKVIVDGKPYVVEVEDALASSTTVTVNGKPYRVDVHSVGSISAVPTSGPAAPAPATPVAAPPAPAASYAAPAPVARPGPSSANEVRAPMPGTILDVRVKVGDQVSSAQELCYLEAMKMKNAIRAVRPATVASIEVSEGQVVAHGQVLFTFE